MYYNLENYQITMTRRYYYRKKKSSKWILDPLKTETLVITPERFNTEVSDDTLKYWRRAGNHERLEHGYFSAGCLPIRLSSIYPSKTVKRTLTFAYQAKTWNQEEVK